MGPEAGPLLLGGWFGVLCSLSPCPLASNLAALGLIARKADAPPEALSRALWYTLGRSLAYAALGWILSLGVLKVWRVSWLLQRTMPFVAGPLLVLLGLAMLGLVPLPSLGLPGASEAGNRLLGRGSAGAFGLGVLLALTFCPISAALFFGSLLPLAAGSALPLGVCAAFGVGSALPVAASGVALAAGTAGVASRFARLRSLEVWGRRLTAGIFLGAGCYLMAKTLGG